MSNVANVRIQLSNGQEAGRTINELTAQSAKLAREIKKMEVGSEDYVKATGDYKKVADRLKEVKTEAFSTAKAQSFLNSEVGQFIPFNKQIGGMVGTFQGLSGAIKAATISQRALNIAIAASGIGLIVIAVVKLVQAFMETQAAMDKVTAVTRPLMAIFERLKGLAQELGGSVFKGLSQILKGDIAEGLKTLGSGVKDAVMGFGDAVKEGARAGTAIDQLQKKIEKAEINMIKRQAELANEYKKMSEIAENVRATDEERRNAAARAMEITNEETKLQSDLIDMKIEKLKLEQSLNDTSREGEKEMAELYAQRLNLETAAVERRTTARSKYNVAIQASEGKEKKAHDEAMKQHEERMKALEAEEAARTKFINDSIAAEIKANEDRKNIDSDMLAGFKAQQQEQFNTRIQSLITMNEAEQRMIDELFFTNQLSQEERDRMMFESQQKALQDRLALLMANGQQSSAAYQELFMNLLQLQYDYEQKQTQTTEDEEKKRKQIRDAGLAAAGGILAGFASLLASSSKQSRRSLALQKAAQSAEVGVNTVREISGIFASTSGWGPAGWALAIGQGALAAARGAAAIKKINEASISDGQAFADGGLVKGPSHRNGGIKFMADGKMNEMEGGEIILTKGVYQDPVLRSFASMINEMGGGRSFAMGGPVSSSIRQTTTMGTTSPGMASSAALMDTKSMEAKLDALIYYTKQTAEKPTLALTQIKNGLKILYDVEQDATF